MTNCVRHAGARDCEVRLAVGRDVLLEVRDDGAGLPSGYRAGVGVAGMRERAEELGGSLVLAPARGGGTLVTAHLPLAAEPGPATPAAAAELVTVAS